MKITIEPRAPGQSSYDLTGQPLHYEWVAAWPCPGCGRRTTELFTEQPTPEQLAAIEADPRCWVCRQHNRTSAPLPLLQP